jgi:hypothetical protein
MFKNNFVVSIRNSHKQILREFGERIYLPFYSDYSLFLKNLRSQRAVVKITIDGTDILGGSSLVIAGNDSLDLERFIEHGNLLAGNKFKFAPIKGNAQDPSSPENGIISVSVQWELSYTLTISDGTTFPYPSQSIPWYGPYFYTATPAPTKIQSDLIYCAGRGISNPQFIGGANVINNTMSCSNVSTGNLSAQATPTSQRGVTVSGSHSDQSFSTTATNILSPEIVILRLQLLAPEEEQKTVENTKTKYCVQCGKKIKGDFKFCPKCGAKQE